MRDRLVIGLLCGLLSVCGTAATQALEFSDFFTGATMRVDLFHTGHATMEYVAIDQVRVEGPWPGSRTQLVDHTNLGKYFFEVVDLAADVIELGPQEEASRLWDGALKARAVAGEGSPDPPWTSGIPVTHLVSREMSSMSRAVVPTSSAVT